MGTGRGLFNAACSFIGEPYSTDPGRTSPTSGFKDCSGLQAAAYQVEMGYDLGAYVTVTQFDMCVKAGLEIPYEYAIHIVGAQIYLPDDPYQGWGPNGHVAMSAGDGRTTVEATPPRVQRLSLDYNGPWSPRAALLPGVDYSNNGEGGAAPAAEKGVAEMWIALNSEQGHQSFLKACQVSGSIVGEEWGPGPVTTNPYGVPDPAVKYHQDHPEVPVLPVNGQTWDRLHVATLWSQVDPRTTIPGEPTKPTDITAFSDSEVLADVLRRMSD